MLSESQDALQFQLDVFAHLFEPDVWPLFASDLVELLLELGLPLVGHEMPMLAVEVGEVAVAVLQSGPMIARPPVLIFEAEISFKTVGHVLAFWDRRRLQPDCLPQLVPRWK